MLRLRPTTIRLSETLALASVQRIMIDRLVHVSGLSNRPYEEPSAESSVFSYGSEYFIPESSLEDFADDGLNGHDISPAGGIKREDSSPEPPMAPLVPDRSDSPPSDIDDRLANQLGTVRLNFTSSFSSSTWLGPFASASGPIDENVHPLSRTTRLPNDPEGRELAISTSNPTTTPPSIRGFTAINSHVPRIQPPSGENASALSKSPSPDTSGGSEATLSPPPRPPQYYTRPTESETATPGDTPRDVSTTQDANHPSKLGAETSSQTAAERSWPPKTVPSGTLDMNRNPQAPCSCSSEHKVPGPLFYCELPYKYHGSNVYAMPPAVAFHLGESLRMIRHEQFELPIDFPDPEFILVAPVMNISLAELVATTCPAMIGRLRRLHVSIETPSRPQRMAPLSQLLSRRFRSRHMPGNRSCPYACHPPTFRPREARRPPSLSSTNQYSEYEIVNGFPDGRHTAPSLPPLPTDGSFNYQNSHRSYHPYQNHQAHEASQPHTNYRLQVLGNIPANHNNINQTNQPILYCRTLRDTPQSIHLSTQRLKRTASHHISLTVRIINNNRGSTVSRHVPSSLSRGIGRSYSSHIKRHQFTGAYLKSISGNIIQVNLTASPGHGRRE
ncbi:hypothetical protein FQN50_001096 [Emmonsiellopsis sp. PD_5]|nr:hypothetical protein FQN50_001096 [Emmonsiellopsis sp. PD_5]